MKTRADSSYAELASAPVNGSQPRRYLLDNAIEDSELPYRARHLLHTLLRRADVATGAIPDQFQPSLAALQNRTGFRHETLLRELNRLEKARWLIRDRRGPGRGRRTRYTVTVPENGPLSDQIGTAENGPPADPLNSGNRSAFAAGNGPHAGPQLDRSTRSSIEARAADERKVIRRFLPGVTDDEIETIRNHPAVRQATKPAAYLTELGRNGDLAALLEQLAGEHHDEDLKRRREQISQMPPCEHGIPGGREPHPDTGLPWACALCRAAAGTGASP